MIKKIARSTVGTSFFGTTITETAAILRNFLGDPTFENNDGLSNINLEWEMELVDNVNPVVVFTVYDWEIFRLINDEEVIEWRIGGYSKEDTDNAREELIKLITGT